MTVTIPISGVIANFEFDSESNVTPTTLRKSLDNANGEDILVTINSPGGGVFAGLEMFSLLKNYPGNVETRIVSLAASMGSVLALAGDEKSAENTALYFVHNAQGVGIGDYRELAKESEFLKDISNLIANLYEEYTSLSLKDAQGFMDDESQFFGSDLELLGFEIVKTGEEPNESQARINAKMKKSEMIDKVKNEKYSDDLEKVAASIDYSKYGLTKKTAAKKAENNNNNAQTPANAGKNNEGGQYMTLQEYLDQNPTAKIEYDDALSAQFEAGKKSMQDVVTPASAHLNNESETIRAMAIDVIKGEKSLDLLVATVSAVDAFKESQNSAAAQTETEQNGETQGQQHQATTDNGVISNEADYQAELARSKKEFGLEV